MVSNLDWLENHSVQNIVAIICYRLNISCEQFVAVRFAFNVFLPLNMFIPYLVDFCVALGTDFSSKELKNSSETSEKRDSAVAILLFTRTRT